MALSKDSIRKLRAVKAAILAEPELYDQRNPPQSEDSCNTPCCLGGWGLWLQNPRPKAYLKTLKVASSCEDMARAFDLSFEDFLPLYVSASGWPEPFASRFEEANSKRKQARVAAARIEYFITTGGL